MKKMSLFIALLVPSISFAALGGIRTLLVDFGGLVKLAIPIVFGLAVLFFFWGIANYILKAGDVKAKEEGKNIMIYGVIAIFVITSIWGLVGFIQRNLGITGGANGGSSAGLGNV